MAYDMELELPPAMESALRARAKAEQRSVHDLVLGVLDRHLAQQESEVERRRRVRGY